MSIRTKHGLNRFRGKEGFFRNLKDRVRSQRTVTVELKDGGKVTDKDVLRWLHDNTDVGWIRHAVGHFELTNIS